MKRAELIEKEEISNYKFAPSDQTISSELKIKLANAEKLGNAFKSKAILTFQTEDGIKKVETTVWAVSEKFIQLKNDVHRPIASLIDIDY
jgi:hypothetical protein